MSMADRFNIYWSPTMSLSRIKFIGGVSLVTLLLILIHPALSEMSLSERSLPADRVIKNSFQAGTGLPVGKIQSVRGEAYIFHRDPSVGYRAKTGLPLYQGDILHTRKNARLFCRLVDGSRLTMAPGTILTLHQSNSNSARNSGMSFLILKQGGARFFVSPTPELSSLDFKLQTETAFVQAQEADFIVKADPGNTEIISFEKSRLEITSLAEPEEIHFLSDYQRAVVRPESIFPVGEAVSPIQAEEMMAGFRLAPDSKLFASSANHYRAHGTAADIPQAYEVPEE